MLLIGLTGAKGAGKSSVAARLCAAHGFWSCPLAEPLKHGLVEMFRALGMTWSHVEDAMLKDRTFPPLGIAPRRLMQTLGTEWGRAHVAEDLWLRVATARLRKAAECGIARAVVPDVRFVNELAWLRARGGLLIEVRRRREHAAADAHASESGIAPGAAEVVLRNDEDLRTLEWRVDQVMADIAHGVIRARAA